MRFKYGWSDFLGGSSSSSLCATPSHIINKRQTKFQGKVIGCLLRAFVYLCQCQISGVFHLPRVVCLPLRTISYICTPEYQYISLWYMFYLKPNTPIHMCIAHVLENQESIKKKRFLENQESIKKERFAAVVLSRCFGLLQIESTIVVARAQ